MNPQIIQIFEWGKLVEGQTYSGTTFTQQHLDALSKYHGDQDDEKTFFSLINHGVRFKQYVGVICVGNLQIEVLPKADNVEGNEGLWKDRLLEMLRVVYRLKLQSPSTSQDNLQRSQILDLFLQRFMDETERILHMGLVKTYRQVAENCNALKGKLLFAQHISKNLIHKERFYVKHTIYDYNHLCNRILLKVLRLIPVITNNTYMRYRAQALLLEFPELLDINADATTFATIQYNRKTEDYRFAMEIARLILLHYMPNMNSEHAHNHVLALMFDMNKLWEEYVYIILKRQLQDGYSVFAQKCKTFWESAEVGTKIIKPDIVVVNKDGQCVAVLDTKWKCPKDDKPSDGDLKQMYVYHKYWETNLTMLLYPGNTNKTIVGEYTKEKDLQCSMVWLSINKKESRETNIHQLFESKLAEKGKEEVKS